MYDPGLLYQDPILTNFSVGYRDQALFGERIMPVTPVRTQSGRYRIFDRSNWLIHESRREPGTVANEILGGKWSEDFFATVEHSLQAPILDEERQQLTSQGGLSDPVFGGDLSIDPELDATSLVMRSLLLDHELRVSTLVRNPANYGAANKVTLAGTSQWNDYTATLPAMPVSNPVNDVQVAMRAVYASTGRYPNTMVVPGLGMQYVENHPRIVDRFKNFSLSVEGAFRTLTGFDGVILPVDSVYNSADHVDATEAITSFWGKDVWIGIVDPNPGQKTFTFGKTFAQIYPDGTVRPTDRWREEARKADIVRTSYKWDTKIVAAGAGYLITNAFAGSAF